MSVKKNLTSKLMDQSARLALTIGGLILLGLLLMTATGLGVYFGFCVKAGSTLNSTTSQLLTCNCTIKPKCKVTRLCPVEKAEPCLAHPLMPVPIDPNACLTPCQPECRPENCMNSTSYDCPPIPAAPPTSTQVPPFHLSPEQLASRTVLEWVTSYPPNSYGRLQVLTQLMEFGVENYVNKMSRRNCDNPFKICTFCQDRFEFLRCAMKMKITGNKFGYRNTNKMSALSANFAKDFSYNAYYYSKHWKSYLTAKHYEEVTAAYQAFWFVSDDGSECHWCREDGESQKQLACIWNGAN